MGKGSERRPTQVGDEKFADAWERTFGTREVVTLTEEGVELLGETLEDSPEPTPELQGLMHAEQEEETN